MIARSTVSRLVLRQMWPAPMRRLGVPPIRSSVQNEKPRILPLSLATVTSTHSSHCFDSSPTSKALGDSVHRSAISAISASLIAVQSLVSTSIAIACFVPHSLTVSMPGWAPTVFRPGSRFATSRSVTGRRSAAA